MTQTSTPTPTPTTIFCPGNLVTNPTFTTDLSGWDVTPYSYVWSWSPNLGGSALFTGSNDEPGVLSQNILTVGETYNISFDVLYDQIEPNGQIMSVFAGATEVVVTPSIGSSTITLTMVCTTNTTFSIYVIFFETPEIYVTNVCITQQPSPTPTPTPTSTPTVTQTPTMTPTSTNPCPNCITQDITIGSQIWAKCNLDVTTYNNGDPIPEVTDQSTWNSLTTGAWCYYDNNSSNGATYGKLYNWYAVNDPRGLSPTGYHVPSESEFITLSTYLGGALVSGGKLKESGLCHWFSPNFGATNISNFTSLPGGFRNNTGFFSLQLIGGFWTTTEYDASFSRSMSNSSNFETSNFGNTYKYVGRSVRLIKD
jgi:uncharacterized protein (TIGR02145 family)